jgi:hypothetical protein
MAYIMNSLSRLLPGALGSRPGRISITRIAIRVFVEFSRVPRTYLAAHMAATGAFLRAGGKERGTEVTVTVDTLAHRSMDEIRAARGRRHLD